MAAPAEWHLLADHLQSIPGQKKSTEIFSGTSGEKNSDRKKSKKLTFDFLLRSAEILFSSWKKILVDTIFLKFAECLNWTNQPLIRPTERSAEWSQEHQWL